MDILTFISKGDLKNVVLEIKKNEIYSSFTSGNHLLWACRYNQLEIVKYLTKMYRADHDCRIYQAKEICRRNGYKDITKYLNSRGWNAKTLKQAKDHYLLFRACKTGNMEKVKTLISMIMSKYGKELEDYLEFEVCLNVACERGHLDVVKHLVSRFSLSPLTMDHESLHLAVRNGHFDVVIFIYGTSRSLSYRSLELASEFGHFVILKYLMRLYHIQLQREGLDNVDEAMDDVKESVLVLSIENNRIDILDYMLTLNIDIQYALNKACSRGTVDIVKYIVSKGADVSAKNNSAVAYSRDVRIVDYLVSKGADDSRVFHGIKRKYIELKYYKKWRRIHLRKWIRRVLTPWYYSPENRGGENAKNDLLQIVSTKLNNFQTPTS